MKKSDTHSVFVLDSWKNYLIGKWVVLQLQIDETDAFNAAESLMSAEISYGAVYIFPSLTPTLCVTVESINEEPTLSEADIWIVPTPV